MVTVRIEKTDTRDIIKKEFTYSNLMTGSIQGGKRRNNPRSAEVLRLGDQNDDAINRNRDVTKGTGFRGEMMTMM